MVLTNKQVTDLVTTRPIGQTGWELGRETSCPPLASSRAGGTGRPGSGANLPPPPQFLPMIKISKICSFKYNHPIYWPPTYIFWPNLSAQAQKFVIFGKKNSLWVSVCDIGQPNFETLRWSCQDKAAKAACLHIS